MKILSLGNNIRYCCSNCKSLLEIDQIDWKYDFIETNENSEKSNRYVVCPVCKKKIFEQDVIEMLKNTSYRQSVSKEIILDNNKLNQSVNLKIDRSSKEIKWDSNILNQPINTMIDRSKDC